MQHWTALSGAVLQATVRERVEGLARTASGAGPRLVSATVEVDPDGPLGDPIAVAFASRRADDRFFCWEQPDRGFALATIGSVHEVVSRGQDRVADLVRGTTRVVEGRLADEPEEMPAGAGPVWVGGMAFAPNGGTTGPWSSFEPAQLVLPEIAMVRSADRAFLTVATFVGPDRDPGAIADELEARLASLRAAPLPPLDPHPTGRVEVRSVLPPAHFESAVAAAVGRIRSGELEKVVLAREVAVSAPSAHDPAALFGALRELFGGCFCFCVGSPEGTFLGASPELLVRRSGAVAATVALAGSTRRSADPAIDDHLGEQLKLSAKDASEHAIVARRIERRLTPHSVWVEAAPEPSLVRVANIQHLATPIHAQLAEPRSALELAGILHPTPAVGGEPADRAAGLIAELERMDRGWYAGPVGWIDMAEDGELCVALRSALLRDRTAHLFAGGGIVAGSDPALELAETEVKLEALLPLVAG